MGRRAATTIQYKSPQYVRIVQEVYRARLVPPPVAALLHAMTHPVMAIMIPICADRGGDAKTTMVVQAGMCATTELAIVVMFATTHRALAIPATALEPIVAEVAVSAATVRVALCAWVASADAATSVTIHRALDIAIAHATMIHAIAMVTVAVVMALSTCRVKSAAVMPSPLLPKSVR